VLAHLTGQPIKLQFQKFQASNPDTYPDKCKSVEEYNNTLFLLKISGQQRQECKTRSKTDTRHTSLTLSQWQENIWPEKNHSVKFIKIEINHYQKNSLTSSKL
jgi:hypothetical protein